MPKLMNIAGPRLAIRSPFFWYSCFVKSPWKRFPSATLSILVLNLLCYCFTAKYFLFLDIGYWPDSLFQYGVHPILLVFYALFIHGNILLLINNMLFFWAFGPVVEDRLGPERLLLVYFTPGIIGGLLQLLINASPHGHFFPIFGASACIMGVMGACWYLYPWSTICVSYSFLFFIKGKQEASAFWIIIIFLVGNIVVGVISGSAEGIENFTNVGGLVGGALLCLAMKVKRDSALLSHVKKEQSELGDLQLLEVPELEILREDDPTDPDILRAMLKPAMEDGRLDILEQAFREAGAALIDKDPALVATYMLSCHGDNTCYTPAMLLHTAHALEDAGDPRRALQIYQIVLDRHPQSPEVEVVLYLVAYCWSHYLGDAENARAVLTDLLQRFPNSPMASQAKTLLRWIGN